MDLSTIRAEIPALSQSIYLNTGTFGPSPSVVIDEVRKALDLIEIHGPYSPIVRQTIERDAYEATRFEVAAFLGATPDEIILTRNASDGINTIAYGLDWRPDDEVVISNEEHYSGMLPWLTLAKRRGIKVRVAPVSNNHAEILQNFSEQITSRTRLVFASHVSCLSGIRLPVAEICQLAHDNGMLAVIDGAHALGQFPVDVREIGCDAYVGCGHKWLLGPQGTSMTYITHENLETFQTSWVGWGAQDELSFDLATQTFNLHHSARRFEFGTKQWPLFPGLTRALYFINNIGLLNIQNRVQSLATLLKQAIDEVPDVQRLTPMEPELSAGIVTLALDDNTPDNLKDLLWERHNLIVAYNIPHRYLRLSVAFFTTQNEIEQALAVVTALVRSFK